VFQPPRKVLGGFGGPDEGLDEVLGQLDRDQLEAVRQGGENRPAILSQVLGERRGALKDLGRVLAEVAELLLPSLLHVLLLLQRRGGLVVGGGCRLHGSDLLQVGPRGLGAGHGQ
jgi:hypothetical protein